MRKVVARIVRNGCRAAEGARGARDIDVRVKSGHPLGECVDERRVERTAAQEVVEAVFALETAHLHRVVDRRARPAEHGQGGRAGDRNDLEVQLRRRAPVERELALAEMPACVERGEIEKAQVDRLFQLVGGVAREQHARDMRFDQADLGARMHGVERTPQSAQERGMRGVGRVRVGGGSRVRWLWSDAMRCHAGSPRRIRMRRARRRGPRRAPASRCDRRRCTAARRPPS